MNRTYRIAVAAAIIVGAALAAESEAYHAPQLGRFLQRDPAGYVDGTNPYRYTASSPLSHRDPSGLAHVRGMGMFQASLGPQRASDPDFMGSEFILAFVPHYQKFSRGDHCCTEVRFIQLYKQYAWLVSWWGNNRIINPPWTVDVDSPPLHLAVRYLNPYYPYQRFRDPRNQATLMNDTGLLPKI